MVAAEHDGAVDVAGTVSRMRKQESRAARREKSLQLFATRVTAGRFDQQIDPQCVPVHALRRVRMRHMDGLVIDAELFPVHLDLARKAAMGRIEARQVGHAFDVGWFVDGHHRNLLTQWRFVQGAQKTAADAAVAVDGDSQRHGGVGIESGTEPAF